jgi:hypothetical protein
VRIINHGLYAGIGVTFGLFFVSNYLGEGNYLSILIVALFTLFGAGLWAQFIEGSPSLLRPYGYYGGIIGGTIGCFIGYALGTDIWLLLGAFAVAGTCIQAWGRVRCLVQGCCHGHQTSDAVGIRYNHPRSRVVRLAKLGGVPVHATPLYSILWNIVCGIVLFRLWTLHMAPSFITGLYFILNGLGRFVEESFRGEPQTPVFGNLHLYHLMAIGSIFTGIVLTSLHIDTVIPDFYFDVRSLYLSAGFGCLVWFALGVDFPNSNKRFARLV